MTATDPKTPPARLQELSQTFSLLTVLAKNPNTPVPILVASSEFAPEEFLQNPSLPLMVLMEPDIWGRLPGILRLAASSRCPESLVEWFLTGSHSNQKSDREALRRTLYSNTSLSEAHRRRVFFQTQSQLRLALSRWTVTSIIGTEHTNDLKRLGMAFIKTREEPDPSMDSESIANLCALGPLAHLLARRHPGCPEVWRERLAGLGDP